AKVVEALRHGGGFGGELRAPVRGGAVAAARHYQGTSAFWIGEAEMQRRKAAHRQADDMRLVDAEAVEHRKDVVAGAVLRIALRLRRHVGGRVTAGVVGNAAVAPAEMAQLRLPRAVVAGELMYEHDRRTRTDLLVKEFHAIVGGKVRHRVDSLVCGHRMA